MTRSEPEAAPDHSPQYIEWKTEFGAIFVVEAGQGRPLLYLHGVGDSGGLIPSIAQLASRRHVVRPDHPGFLRSADGGFGAVRELAAWYADQLDTCALADIDLVGCSLGGWIASELALLRPDRIRTLTLIDPAGLAGDDSIADIFSLSPSETLRRTFASAALQMAAPPSPERTALLTRNRDAARKIATDPFMHDPSLDQRLAQLTLPVHLIWGADDGLIPVTIAEAWRASIPHATLTVIPDAGHLPHVEQAELFLAAVPHLEN